MALVLRMTSTMPVLEAVTHHINCLDEEVVEVEVSTEGGA